MKKSSKKSSKNSEVDKYIHEKYLISSGRATLIHSAERNGVTTSFYKCGLEAKQLTRVEAPEAFFWYRCMSKDQFDNLRKKDKIVFTDGGYGGIATNFNYCNGYLTNNQGSHIVEFIPSIDNLKEEEKWNLYSIFKQRMKESRLPFVDPKAEGDGGTFGLGFGCNNGRYGEIFNELLLTSEFTYRLVKFKLISD